VDVSVPGFRISESSVASMVTDMEVAMSGLIDDKTIVLIQPFDNSIYFSSQARGEKVLTRKGSDGKYHVHGELKMVGKEDMKSLFLEIIPMIKAVKGKKVVVMGPMPRYLFSKCCSDPNHLTNFSHHDYVDSSLQALRDVYGWINSSIFMRRMKDVKVFNLVSALGFLNEKMTRETLSELWGPDPVHPTQEAYHMLATKVAETCDDIFAGSQTGSKSLPKPKPATKRPAESSTWMAKSEPVAKRLIPSPTFKKPYAVRGGGGNRGGQEHGYPISRGGRGGGNARERGRGGAKGFYKSHDSSSEYGYGGSSGGSGSGFSNRPGRGGGWGQPGNRGGVGGRGAGSW